MKREELLQQIKILAQQKKISQRDLIEAFTSGSSLDTSAAETEESFIQKIGIPELLTYIGGGIVFAGIAIFIWQNWFNLDFGTKVAITLGAGITSYILGLFLYQTKRTEIIGHGFFLISSLTLSIGLWVIFQHWATDSSLYSLQILISATMLVLYLSTALILRKNIFIIFSIVFGTWLFFSSTSYIAQLYAPVLLQSWWIFGQYRMYRFALVSICYLLLGYFFGTINRRLLHNLLYNVGIFLLLTSTFFLTSPEESWRVAAERQNFFREFLYPFIILGTMLLGIYLKRTAFLVWSSLFLMLFILRITLIYFSTGLGWPLALVISGLALMGVGYLFFVLKNKYINE